MSIYKPTWLYIKQHKQTGLKYFGKTVRDPFKYKGSGIYWKSHLLKHGEDIITLWCQLFLTEKELIEYAQKFSLENNIVESKEWANLIDENGYGGGVIGHLGTQLFGKANGMFGKEPWIKGKTLPPQSEVTRKKKSIALLGKNKGKIYGPQSEETRAKKSKALTGFKRPPRTIEHIEKLKKSRQENKRRRLLLENNAIPTNPIP